MNGWIYGKLENERKTKLKKGNIQYVLVIHVLIYGSVAMDVIWLYMCIWMERVRERISTQKTLTHHWNEIYGKQVSRNVERIWNPIGNWKPKMKNGYGKHTAIEND